MASAPQFDAALVALVAAIAQADQLLRTAAAAAPSAEVLASLASKASAAAEAAFAIVRAAWSAALALPLPPVVAAAVASVQQVLNEALTAAAPALAAASPFVQATVAHWHALLRAAAAMPPAHSLAAALAALYFTRGRAQRKGPEPRLPLGPLRVAASHARHSFAELAALSEALRFSLVAAAPAGAVVPPAQRKEASVALAALVADTEALLAALQRAQAAALAGGKPVPVTPSGATSRSR